MKKYILIVYALIWAGMSILLLANGAPLSMLFIEDALIIIHAIFIIIVLPIYIIRCLIIAKRNNNLGKAFRQIIIRLVIPIGLCFIALKIILIYNKAEDYNYSWDYSIENTKNIYWTKQKDIIKRYCEI